MKHLILIALLSCTVTGCSTTGNVSLKKITQENVKKNILRGKTTAKEVINKYGDPMDVTFNTNGTKIFKYHLSEYSATPAQFIPIVGIFADSNYTAKYLTVFFDSKNIVKDYLLAKIKNKPNTVN